jgi:short-subunit dehydrogenase
VTYRSALITGASSGIGRAFARILVPQTHLTLAGRRSAELTALAAEIAAPERSIETIAADLAIREERDTVIAAAKRAEIDLFICNAGIARAGPFGASAPAADYETIDINVIATVGLLHALIPPMIENAKRQKQRGGIVVVASVVALTPSPGLASYGASKAFQLHLTQSLAAELRGEPLDLLALCPTYTRTEFFVRAGLPSPSHAMSAEEVARQGMDALGRRTLHLCGTGPLPQALRRLLALNRALDPRQWPRSLAEWMKARRS